MTILVPFKPLHEMTEAELGRLRGAFARFRPFAYSLPETRRFPGGVVYLAPVSDEPFRRLTMAVWHEFPEYPPYGGAHAEVIPHLTVAQVAEAAELARVCDEFERACAGRLPISATATEVVLMDDASGRWQRRKTFPLGQAFHSPD